MVGSPEMSNIIKSSFHPRAGGRKLVSFDSWEPECLE